MQGSWEETLAELESVTAEMAAADLPLETLAELGARRGRLARNLAAHRDFAAADVDRIRHVIEQGAAIISRVEALRQSIRQESADLDRSRLFMTGLEATIAAPDVQPGMWFKV